MFRPLQCGCRTPKLGAGGPGQCPACHMFPLISCDVSTHLVLSTFVLDGLTDSCCQCLHRFLHQNRRRFWRQIWRRFWCQIRRRFRHQMCVQKEARNSNNATPKTAQKIAPIYLLKNLLMKKLAPFFLATNLAVAKIQTNVLLLYQNPFCAKAKKNN